MYGKVRVVLGLWSSISFLLLGHEYLCTKRFEFFLVPFTDEGS